MDPWVFRPWYPTGTKRIIAAGSSNYIAIRDDEKTVLKYPLVPPHDEPLYDAKGQAYRDAVRSSAVHGLATEEKILRVLGDHPRIVCLRETHETGLVLEYLPNGTVGKYLRDIAPTTTLQQRLKWARQAAEAVAFIHTKNVLHCDISIGNLLLDANLDIRLIDFQGKLISPDGAVLLDGGASEGAMSSMPRQGDNRCDSKTDIFALGTSMFYVITGRLPFTDVDPLEDDEEIQRRFREEEWPALQASQGGEVVRRCWKGSYQSAEDIVRDLNCLEKALE